MSINGPAEPWRKIWPLARGCWTELTGNIYEPRKPLVKMPVPTGAEAEA